MISKHSFKKTHNNFYEKQKFYNIYFLIILVITEAVCLYTSAVKILGHNPFVFSSFEHWPLVIFTLLGPSTILFLYMFLCLETIFNDDGIFYRWSPLSNKFKMIQWDSIREIGMIDLKNANVMLRFSKEYDNVHYVGSAIGIRIVMRSGKKRLIGTRKAEALNRILVRLAGKSYQPNAIVDTIDYKD